MRLVLTISAVFALVFCPHFYGPTATADDPGRQPCVLILNSYHQGYHWSDKELAGLLEGLGKGGSRLSVMIEHLDLKRFQGKAQEHRLAAFLEDKYRAREVDLIIALDNSAFDFTKNHRDRLLPSVPIVFAGVNNFSDKMLDGLDKITGLAQIQDHQGTVALALSLHPGTRRIFCVHDYTDTGLALRKEMEDALQAFRGRVRVDFNSPSTYEEIASEIAGLPGDSVVVILSFAADREGKSLNPPSSTQALTARARVPVYGINEVLLGDGILGGLLISGEAHGRRAAEIALRVLAGEVPSSIPVESHGTSLPMFDYRQMVRFGVPLDALPAGSKVIHCPCSFYDEYKELVWASASIATVLGGLVIALGLLLVRKHRAEEAVRTSEEKYRRIVETANEGIWAIDSEFATTFVNPRMAEMLGYSPEEMLGKRMDAFLFEKDLGDHQARLESRRQGVSEVYERRFLRKDGGELWTMVSASPILNSQGGFAGSFAMYSDITERKMSELTRMRLAEAVEQAAEAVVITDRKANIQYVNPAFERITGYGRSEVIGKKPSLFDSKEHDPAFLQNLRETLLRGERWAGRLTQVRKDGTLYHEDTTISPVRDSSGRIVNFVAVKRDISEEVQLQRQLLQAQKLEAVGTLAGGIAHDFNNLLQVVLGYSEFIMEDESLSPAARSDVAQIVQAARNGAELVKGLLTFGRKNEMRPVPLNLNHEIQKVQKLLFRTIPKMIHLEQVLDENLPKISADPTQIEQILMNLAVNSKYAMPEGGRLIFQTENVSLDQDCCRTQLELTPGNYVRLRVTDTGTGMDKATVQRIFEPFFSTKEPSEGTGLGLAVVYGIVKQHGGHILCQSEPGSGTTFDIYFPALEKQSSSDETSERSEV